MTTQEIETVKLGVPAHQESCSQRVCSEPVSWSVPLTLLACVLLAFFDKISIAALFSDVHFQQAMGIGFDTTRLGMLMSAFLLAYGFSSVFLSGIGDRFNPAKILVGMMITWGILMVFMGLTHSYRVMMGLRILLGLAEGPLFALAFAIVRQAFPQHLQARATMLWLLGTPIGAAIGFPVTMLILNHYGWQSTFFFMAILSVPVILLAAFGLRSISRKEKNSETKPAVISIQERREARRELLSYPHFWMICLFNIAFLTYLWGMNGWLPSYLIEGKGIHLEHAGYLSSLPFIAMLLGEMLGAWISDRTDRRALSCFVSMAGAGVGLVVVLYAQSTGAVIAAMSLSMFMWGVGAPNIFALLAKATSARISATAGGIFNGLGNFAGALAPVAMGALIARSNNMDSGLIFLAVISVLGCLLLLPLVKRY